MREGEWKGGEWRVQYGRIGYYGIACRGTREEQRGREGKRG